MTTHRLKVFIKYADAIMNGTKTFEIRKNDRNFKVGDKIVFDVVSNEGISIGAAARHPLNGQTYRIDYILDDFEGLAQKYVAFAISKENEWLPMRSAASWRRRRCSHGIRRLRRVRVPKRRAQNR